MLITVKQSHILFMCITLEHTNHAMWLSVHIRDVCSLEDEHHSLYEELTGGRFVAHKTINPLSGMALDKAHEQVSSMDKGNGGAVELILNKTALHR